MRLLSTLICLQLTLVLGCTSRASLGSSDAQAASPERRRDGGHKPPGRAPDAGAPAPSVDGGSPRTDAGWADAGRSLDAGSLTDAGQSLDAGSLTDAGSPSSSTPLDHLILIDQGRMSPAELVTVQSLQGVLAQTDPQLWIQGGISNVFLDDLVARHQVSTETATLPWALVKRFAPQLKGYVLYDAAGLRASIDSAISLAGPMRAIAVDAPLEANAIAAGLTRVADVRGKNGPALWASYGASFFAPGVMVEQQDALSGFLLDFAVSRRAFTFYDGGNSPFRTTVARGLGPHAIDYGWGGDCCELNWVQGLSAGEASGVAANFSRDLSALQWAREPDLQQRTHHRRPIEEGVHYVAFVMSDGDNIQWLSRDFMLPKWWGSPLRGQFNMTWEMAPILADVAPSMLRYYQLQASTREGARDFFVAGPSGHGYMLPSLYPGISGFVDRYGGYADRADLHIATLLDQASAGGMASCDPYLANPSVVAAIYKDYSDYNRQAGALRWYAGKPCLAYRYLLWDNGSVADSPAGVAQSLAGRPTHPLTDPGSYSLVNVHAWSSWRGSGAMAAVQQTIGALPPSVRVVTAEELFVLMRQQFGTPAP